MSQETTPPLENKDQIYETTGFSFADINAARRELAELSKSEDIPYSTSELDAFSNSEIIDLIDTYTAPEAKPQEESVSIASNDEVATAPTLNHHATPQSTQEDEKRPSFVEKVRRTLSTPRRLAAIAMAAVSLGGGIAATSTAQSSEKVPGTSPVTHVDNAEMATNHETQSEQFDFHFFDENKESEHAFGARGDSSSVEAAVADMENRYIGEDGKSDPALIAAHAKELGLYDGLSVNELANKLQDDKGSLAHAVEMLKDIYKTGEWKLVDSPSDYGSLYMIRGKDGKPNIYFDRNVEHTNAGKALQLKIDGKIVAIFRTDCGFQPVMLHIPSYLPTPDTPPKTSTDTDEKPKPKTKLEEKDPSQDINRNPNLNPDANTNGHIAEKGDKKPATDPPKTYTPPVAPTPAPTVERPTQSIPPVETGANGTSGVNNGPASQQPAASGV